MPGVKGRSGRRGYKPTEADRSFVDRAVMAGSRINDIADALNVTDDTLRKHFRYEIMTARERLKGDAVRVIMDSLADSSLDAAKFVMARVGGWSENMNVNNTSSDGSMTPAPTVAIDPSKLSTEALRELVTALAEASEPD